MANGDETQAGPRPSLPPHRPGSLADDRQSADTWAMGAEPPRDPRSGSRAPMDNYGADFDSDFPPRDRAPKPHILAPQANEWAAGHQEVEVVKGRRTGLILLFLLALLVVVLIALGLALFSVFNDGEDLSTAGTDTTIGTDQDGTSQEGTDGTEGDQATVTSLPPVDETTVPDPNALKIEVTEEPFICNGEARAFAQISGASPAEQVAFSSPQTENLSSGTADANGDLPIRWSCTPDQAGTTWELTATGATSGKTATFIFAGALNPEPAPGETPTALTIVLNENPFACNDEVRVFGKLGGADPGEEISFTSPQASGIKNGTADELGEVSIRWSCSADQVGTTWDLTATGVTSGRTVTFRFSGA